LQALLDINSAQTEKELAEQLGVTQQAMSVCLHTMGRKADGFRMNCPNNKNRWRDTALTLLSKFRKKDFLYKIITGDDKRILYDNPKCRKSWVDLIKLRHRRQSPISTPRRFCSVFGGIGSVALRVVTTG